MKVTPKKTTMVTWYRGTNSTVILAYFEAFYLLNLKIGQKPILAVEKSRYSGMQFKVSDTQQSFSLYFFKHITAPPFPKEADKW